MRATNPEDFKSLLELPKARDSAAKRERFGGAKGRNKGNCTEFVSGSARQM